MSQTINLDTTPGLFMPTLRFSQGDIGREFKINLTSSDGYSIPDGATVEMAATKPSGFGFVVSGSLSGNVATFVTTATMTAEAGRFQAEIRIKKNNDVIGTANFMLDGERNPHPEGTVDGDASTIIPQLTLLVERVEAAASSILDMNVEAETLQAGSDATYEYDEETNTVTFGIPQGEAGGGTANVVARAYSASSTYAVDDYVIHDGALYKCKTAITTAEEWTSGHWTQDVLVDDLTELKENLTQYSVTGADKETKLYEVKIPSNRTSGYLKSDGTIGSASDAYVSDWIKVEGDYCILWLPNDYTGTSIHVCTYDESKTLVSYSNPSRARDRIVIALSATVRYVRFDCLNNFYDVIAYCRTNSVINQRWKESDITVLGTVKSHKVSLLPFALYERVGFIDVTNGNIAYSGSSARTIGFIPLFNTSDIYYDMSVGVSGNFHIAFYDDDFAFIEAATLAVTSHSCEVPSGSKYILFDTDISWAGKYNVWQVTNKSVPDKYCIEESGAFEERFEALENVSMKLPLNIKYRGLLAGFGNNEVKLRVFGTKNFHYFEQIGNTFTPTKGNEACRDPFIMIYEDYFYIFYTDTPHFMTDNNDIGVCRTLDFVTYEELEPIVCNEDFKVCWAPSVFEENGNYYLTITGSTLNYSETYTYLYDLDMDTLTISNERIISVGTSTRQLDFHFMKVKGLYYAIGKYDDESSTVIAYASTLNGPYTVLTHQRYSNKPEEGQQLLRLDNGSYRLYINDFSQDQLIHYVDIPDIARPTENVGSLKTISDDSPVDLYHVFVLDLNRAYCFDEN